MSEVTSHPDAALVIAHATGSLEPKLALLVAAHLELCPHCRALAASVHEAGGAILDAIQPVDLHAGALDAVMARIDADATPPMAPTSHVQASQVLADEFGLLPAQVQRAVQASGRRLRFRKRGVSALDLGSVDPDGAGQLTLYRIAPGAAVPFHGHKGAEITLVLTGAFSDESGTYRTGDVAIGAPDVHHRPRADQGPVCFALAYTDAPLAFTGLIGAMQRVLKPLGIGR